MMQWESESRNRYNFTGLQVFMYKLTPQYQKISIFDFNQPGGSSFPPTTNWSSWWTPLSGTSTKNSMLSSFLLKQDVQEFLFVLPLAHTLSRRQPELLTENYVSSLQKTHIISISLGWHRWHGCRNHFLQNSYSRAG